MKTGILQLLLNSNTTLVKVKLTQTKENGEVKYNSNTTLVKVKCNYTSRITWPKLFKYNTC